MPKLILIRHGQSMWNKANVFTGWVDVPLSQQGIEEALDAGRQLSHLEIDTVYTSVQIRAIQTAMLSLSFNAQGKVPYIIPKEGKMEQWSKIYNQDIIADMIPVWTDWHLNERYYGHLQGLNKAETAKKFGDEQVKIWRRSYNVPPPEGESLEMTAQRTIPFFQEHILLDILAGKTVMVSAHGNSLRSIVMYLDGLSSEEVLKLEIPTGRPIIYDYLQEKWIHIS